MLTPYYGVPDSWAFRQAIFVQNTTNQTLCNSLNILNCSTITNEELINELLVPVVRDLVDESLKPVAIYTRLTYRCRMGVRDEPVITYQLGGSTVSTCVQDDAPFTHAPPDSAGHTLDTVSVPWRHGRSVTVFRLSPHSLILARCRGLT